MNSIVGAYMHANRTEHRPLQLSHNEYYTNRNTMLTVNKPKVSLSTAIRPCSHWQVYPTRVPCEHGGLHMAGSHGLPRRRRNTAVCTRRGHTGFRVVDSTRRSAYGGGHTGLRVVDSTRRSAHGGATRASAS